MRSLLLSSICSLAFTVAAFAADYPKGTYSVSGFQMCLTAPSGFASDSRGNPTIPNGNNSFFAANTLQGMFTYNGDGTGQVTGVYTSITPPPPDSRSAPKPAISGGTFSYEFTTTPIVDHRFSISTKPEMAKGTIDLGTAAGQQYSLDLVHRDFFVSNNSKTMTMTVVTPYVETVTSSGSPNVHTTRSCMVTGNLNRME
jgi:hypothetical protein